MSKKNNALTQRDRNVKESIRFSSSKFIKTDNSLKNTSLSLFPPPDPTKVNS